MAGLRALYEATGGFAWTAATNWFNGTICAADAPHWFGTSCDEGRVSFLSLPANNLSGTLPTEIGLLSGLIFFQAAHNTGLVGTLPSQVGSLPNLQDLRLEVTAMSGSLPTELGTLQALQGLSIQRNRLSGSLPVELAENASNLITFEAFSNRFTGMVPQRLGSLPQLQRCELTATSNNPFTNRFECPVDTRTLGVCSRNFRCFSPPPSPGAPPNPPFASQPSDGSLILGLSIGLPFMACAALAMAAWFFKARAHLRRQQALLRSARQRKGDSFELQVNPVAGGTQPSEMWCTSRALPLRRAISQILRSKTPSVHIASDGSADRFAGAVREFVTGHPSTAAGGINSLLGANDDAVHAAMADGIAAIVREFAPPRVSEMAAECLHYVLYGRAGESETVFDNGRRDVGRHGETLQDFVDHPNSRLARLSTAHVAALRLYTTAAYAEINDPLRHRVGGGVRDGGNGGVAPTAHPFPVLVNFINEAIRQLRAVHADSEDALQPMALWRGMRDIAEPPEPFLEHGGTELAFMSSTTQLQVALEYALLGASTTSNCLLLKMKTRTFIERGADLAYLSCFPTEAEVLFPPLTYLRPTGYMMKLSAEDLKAEIDSEAQRPDSEALWPSIIAVEVEVVIP